MTTIQLKDPSLLQTKCYVAGEWQDADSKQTFDVTDPATGNVIASGAEMGEAGTRRAIDAAKTAWSAWRKKTGKERGAILRKWYDLMIANIDDLALILTTEQGKPLAEAKGEIQYAASFIEWFGEEA